MPPHRLHSLTMRSSRQQPKEESSANTMIHPQVLKDLQVALGRQDWMDLQLTSSTDDDDAGVMAHRLVVAARSPVFRSMLYGPFQEGHKQSIALPFSTTILQGIVDWCHLHSYSCPFLIKEEAMAYHVELWQAAEYLELSALQESVHQWIQQVVVRDDPPMACLVYELAPCGSSLEEWAYKAVIGRPYLTLPGLPRYLHHASKLQAIFQCPTLPMGEGTLFAYLQEWVQVQQQEAHDDDTVTQVAQACARHLRLEYLEPALLVGPVAQSGWIVPSSRIASALTTQALQASSHGQWALGNRGCKQEAVLVEGAGDVQANGLYLRIPGLHHGWVYSKQGEVACGQSQVYTLSCCSSSDRPSERECRIFSAKLLTHQAMPHLVATWANLPSSRRERPRRPTVNDFQPVLQVLERKEANFGGGGRDEEAETEDPLRKPKGVVELLLSDGDCTLKAYLAPALAAKCPPTELKRRTLLKLVKYDAVLEPNGQHQHQLALRLFKVSLLSTDPGHVFGSPKDYYTLETSPEWPLQSSSSLDESSSSDEEPVAVPPKESASSPPSPETGDGALRQLYVCRYSMEPSSPSPQQQQQRRSNKHENHLVVHHAHLTNPIPSHGWQVVDGTNDDENAPHHPPPKVRWIPPAPTTTDGTTKTLAAPIPKPILSPPAQVEKVAPPVAVPPIPLPEVKKIPSPSVVAIEDVPAIGPSISEEWKRPRKHLEQDDEDDDNVADHCEIMGCRTF